MGNKTILLVRHGDYDLTIQFPDNPDGPLNEKGQQQSDYVARRLQKVKIDVIYASPLIRARETAAIIAKYSPSVPLQYDNGLQECIPNVPKGLEKHFVDIPANFIERGPVEAENAFTTYFNPLTADEADRTEVIISHGNLIGYLVARAMDANRESWLRADLGNCCIDEIRIMPSGNIKLMRLNDGEHLPPELR